MQELKELIKVGLSGRVSGIETFNQFTSNKNSLTFKLFSHISEGKINSDDEAKALLYGDRHKGFKYSMLKERFREKLYTNVLFVQPRKRDTKSYAHNAYFCHKYFIVAKLLLMIVAKNAGRNLMKKVLSRAEAFQVHEIAFLAAAVLRRETLEQGNLKEFKQYAALFKKFHAIVTAENEAEEMHDNLMMHFTKSYSVKPDLVNQASLACKYIKKLKNQHNTYYLNQAYFQSQILYFDLLNDYTATLKACKDFESYLQGQPKFYSSVRQGNLIILKLNSLLYLQRFTEGLALANKSAEFYEASEGNWLALKEMHFLLAIRSSDYIQAAEVFKLVTGLLKSRNVEDRTKEIWRLFGGYLWFCLTVDNNLKTRDEVFGSARNFKLSKLLNELPIYTKDKQGINLSLSILQLALLIQAKDFQKVIEKIEHLKIYIYKYINRKEGARDFTMLSLILLLPKFNFDFKIIEKKSTPLTQKLNTLPVVNNAYVRSHIEIIQYEQLWGEILIELRKSS